MFATEMGVAVCKESKPRIDTCRYYFVAIRKVAFNISSGPAFGLLGAGYGRANGDTLKDGHQTGTK